MTAPDPPSPAAARSTIHQRIESLRPLVVEFNLLRIALMALDIEEAGAHSRVERAFIAIQRAPGSTAREIAAASRLTVGSVYPALRTLAEQGFAHRISLRWFPGLRDPAAHGATADLTSLDDDVS